MRYTSPKGALCAPGDTFRLSAGTIEFTIDEIEPSTVNATGQVLARHPKGPRVRIPLDACLVRVEAAS